VGGELEVEEAGDLADAERVGEGSGKMYV